MMNMDHMIMITITVVVILMMMMDDDDNCNNVFMFKGLHIISSIPARSVRVAEWLALPTSDHGVVGSNPAAGEILPEPKRRFIAQSLSCSPFHRLEMTEILLKGRKTLTHPSIQHSSTQFLNAQSKYCLGPTSCFQFLRLYDI